MSREIIRPGSLRCFSTLTVLLLLFSLCLAGCGKNGSQQAKQRFSDEIMRIIVENQSHPEIKEKGRQAFVAYYNSGFNDLEKALQAAESFEESNSKDALTLIELGKLEKPDDRAAAIVAGLEEGIRTMDEGNSQYARELRKAADQSPEERAGINPAGKAIMERYYLDGLDAIITALDELLAYVKDNGLKGEKELQDIIEGFRQERKDLEMSLRFM